ncbi:MAG: hypothetical protein E7399_07755 [Ruminococcaceae bacterium]|nr:hypothetical protein [Oscillospiraceae bacterium]
MKKISVLLVVLLFVSLTGCTETNSEANRYVDKTFEAIETEEFEIALQYANKAIEKGNENPEFEKIATLLKQYHDAMDWLDKGRVMKAEEIYEEITDYEDTALKSAIEALEDAIEDGKEQIKDDIETLRESVDEERYYTAEKEAKAVLGKDLTEEQKEEVIDLLTKAYRGQDEDETSTPKPQKTPTPTTLPAEVNLTPEQLEPLIRNTLNLPANAVVTIGPLDGEYYPVNITIDYGDGIVDETLYRAHCSDGSLEGLAG